MDWIYNAIMGLLTDILKEVVNDQLNEVLVEAMLQLGNDGLGTMKTISGDGHKASDMGFCDTDQRWWKIEMIESYMKVFSSGQRCKVDSPKKTKECLGYYQIASQSNETDFLTNNDFQYQISLESLQSGYQLALKLGYLENITGISVTNISFHQMHNTGIEQFIEVLEDD